MCVPAGRSGAGSRKATSKIRKLEALLPNIVELVTDHPGVGVGEMVTALRTTDLTFQDREVSQAAK
jgi:hypothetical protein